MATSFRQTQCSNEPSKEATISLFVSGVVRYVQKGQRIFRSSLPYDFSIRLWGKILQEFSREWVIPRFATDLLSLGQGFLLQKKGKILWKVTITSTFWTIWLERNRRIFEGVEENFESISDRIKLWVGIWLHNCKDFNNVPFTLIIRDWNTFL